jgi:hypothetical protein
MSSLGVSSVLISFYQLATTFVYAKFRFTFENNQPKLKFRIHTVRGLCLIHCSPLFSSWQSLICIGQEAASLHRQLNHVVSRSEPPNLCRN